LASNVSRQWVGDPVGQAGNPKNGDRRSAGILEVRRRGWLDQKDAGPISRR
jgi:hypothetical protein